jgi:hypothetical protein
MITTSGAANIARPNLDRAYLATNGAPSVAALDQLVHAGALSRKRRPDAEFWPEPQCTGQGLLRIDDAAAQP